MTVSNVNRAVLTGRLVEDAVLETLPSGFPMCNFELEVQRRRQDPESGAWVQYASCFDVLVPGNLADSIAGFLRRGREVAVDAWLDVRPLGDGARSVRVVADGVELLGANVDEGAGGRAASHSNGVPRAGARGRAHPSAVRASP